MSSWMNEAAVQSHNAASFAHMNDPNAAAAGNMMDPAAFMANAQFNPAAAQFANPQQMMAMQNAAAMRNPSPSFSQPIYQTNSIVPSKRPRPREDSIASSPQQNPGMLPTSRSETPQQSQFQNYPQNAGGGPGMPSQGGGQPSPYPHLQPNGSANATPSPIMANQMRPGGVPQRVSTTSPHPFSPAAQNFGPQASPVPSEHGGTPQPNPYMQQGNFPQGFNPAYPPTPTQGRPSPSPNPMAGQQMMPQQMGQMAQMGQMGQMGQMAQMNAMGQMGPMGQMPNQMYTQQQMAQMNQGRNAAMEQQKMLYRMQLQQQLGQGGMAMPQQMPGQPNMAQQQQQQQQPSAQPQTPQRNMMGGRPQMMNGQMPPGAGRPQPPGAQVQNAARQQADQFLQQVMAFAKKRNMAIEMSPTIAERQVHLMQLFQTMLKFGGYRQVSQTMAWPQVAAALGFNPMQVPTAPMQVKTAYERNLMDYEEAWRANKQQAAMQGTPTKPMHPGAMMQPGQAPQMSPGPAQSPVKMPQQGPQTSVNGIPPTQQPMGGPQPPHPVPGQPRHSISKGPMATPTHEEFAVPSPAHAKTGSVGGPGATLADGYGAAAEAPVSKPPEDPELHHYLKYRQEKGVYAGIRIFNVSRQAADIQDIQPDVPSAMELGNIDISALTRSLQCGIHGEVRLALDILATVTHSPQANLVVDLTKCDDLIDSLIDCAEEQVEALAENTIEVSDEILITSYEDVVRSCKQEHLAHQELPAFGTSDYDLDRAVDRLICVTTILRNLSFHEINHESLADESLVRFLCVVIRYLGTRNMLLRTQINTLDFMKDVVILLSNISAAMEIPGREQALCLLQFLLAFSPSPAPDLAQSTICFAPYEPLSHAYMPHAVDALAKLLARDEPNRNHYRHIFSTDATGSNPHELLTRAFALAVSPIPDQNRDLRPPSLMSLVEARKPLLMQGLLAGDIMASLAPNHESGVARAWLESGHGFAQNLFRFIRVLSAQFEGAGPVPHGRNQRNQPRKDFDLVYIVGLGISLLRRLTEKARDPYRPDTLPTLSMAPSSDSVLKALSMTNEEWTRQGFLQHLVAYAALHD